MVEQETIYFLHYLYVGIGTDWISVLLRMEEDIYEVKHSLGIHLVKKKNNPTSMPFQVGQVVVAVWELLPLFQGNNCDQQEGLSYDPSPESSPILQNDEKLLNTDLAASETGQVACQALQVPA